jgi:hypothetical protein
VTRHELEKIIPLSRDIARRRATQFYCYV